VVDLRALVLRDVLAAPDDFEAEPDFAPLDFAEDERVEPAPDDFALVDVDLRPPVEPVLVLRPVPLVFRVVPLLPDLLDEDARDAPELERLAVERAPDDLAPLLREEDFDDPLPELDEEPSSPVHLPDITRCAASATASAMIEPSFVALDIMLVAALEAVSAASSPASRIFRRAAGLALIAAAAAARPAASISLLIAALASLSTVSFELFEDLEEFLRVDLAMAFLPPLRGKRHMTAVTVP
jgi:hypothetical protein